MPTSSGLVVSRTAIPTLTRWGVTPEADLVYRALVEFGPQILGDLSRSLGLASARVRVALDELAEVDAARPGLRPGRVRRPDQARQWAAAAPERATAVLRARHLAAVRARYHVNALLAGLQEVRAAAGVPDLWTVRAVRPLYGVEQVRSRLAELLAGVQGEYLSMQPEPAFDAAAVRAAAPLDRAVCARGVSMLSLGVPAAEEDASTAHGAELRASGVRYRELPLLPAKLMIFSRRTVLLPIDPADTGKGAFEVTAEPAVTGLTRLFLHRWDEAHPPVPQPVPAVVLSEREQAIVALLATGYTDAAASIELGISVRTIAYTVRGLMDRFAVRNRFQLGLVLSGYAAELLPARVGTVVDATGEGLPQ